MNLKTGKFFAFLLLFVTIFALKDVHATLWHFVFGTLAVIFFWVFHAMKFSFTNIRTILLLLAGFGVAVFAFKDHIPFMSSHSQGMTGAWAGLDLTPGMIEKLKTSHELALEIYLGHKPTLDDRYFKTGSLKETDNGLHYQVQKTELRPDLMPETKRWADATLTHKTVTEKISLIENWWRRDFHYSLNPGTMDGPHPLDAFLFEQKNGFCEHYAAALATLLKLSGEGTRVAVGFSGGSWNPLLRKLSFEMADAHAWVEVLNTNTKTWERVDPTLWVSPNENSARSDASTEIIVAALFAFLVLLAFVFSFRKTDPMKSILNELARFEKKHDFSSFGLTIEERFARLTEAVPTASAPIQHTLSLYQLTYFQDEPHAETEKLLAKSVRKWRFTVRKSIF